MNTLFFALQTIPDIDGARRIYDLHGLSDEDVARAIFQKQRQCHPRQDLAFHLHQVVGIAVVLNSTEQFKLWSLGKQGDTEEALLQRFFGGLERYQPQLVSWQGNEFEWSILQLRALRYGIENAGVNKAQEMAGSSYSTASLSLSAQLSWAKNSPPVSLDALSRLCGLPGIAASSVESRWQRYLASELPAMRNENELSALSCFLIWLNWQCNQSKITQIQLQEKHQIVRQCLQDSAKSTHIEFARNWVD